MSVVGSQDIPHVVVFARPPVPGRAKTRLAATVGEDAAARLATSFLRDTLALCRTLPDHQIVLATVEPLAEYADQDSPLGRELAALPIWPQGEGDLGARMERAVRRALDMGPWAMIVGTDSPGLPLANLESAVRSLQHSDAVVGPTLDGGYYMLGMRRCPEGALDGLPWSSPQTCAATLERLYRLGLEPTVAPTFLDIDTEEDLNAWLAGATAGLWNAPFTDQALAELGMAVPPVEA